HTRSPGRAPLHTARSPLSSTTLFRSAELADQGKLGGGLDQLDQVVGGGDVLLRQAGRLVVAGVVHAQGAGLGVHRRDEGRHATRSEEHTSELQSRENLVCRLLLDQET